MNWKIVYWKCCCKSSSQSPYYLFFALWSRMALSPQCPANVAQSKDQTHTCTWFSDYKKQMINFKFKCILPSKKESVLCVVAPEVKHTAYSSEGRLLDPQLPQTACWSVLRHVLNLKLLSWLFNQCASMCVFFLMSRSALCAFSVKGPAIIAWMGEYWHAVQSLRLID